jgi:hypothetical protein
LLLPQKKKKLPESMVNLLTSLEEEFEELNKNYVSLLSNAVPDKTTGKLSLEKLEDADQLVQIASKMKTKEEQLTAIRASYRTAASPNVAQ